MAEQLVIDHVGHRGDGVALADGHAAYVPYALAGETVEVETVPGHAERRRLVHVAQPSPERIAPFCPRFGRCGGCAIQHWQAGGYRAWKRQLVVDALAQAGIAAPVDDLVDAHGTGRRRLVAHARRGSGTTLQVGFSAAGSHDIVPLDQCPILDPALDGAFAAAKALAGALAAVGKPLDIQITATTAGLDIDVRGSGPLAGSAMVALSQLTAQHRIARLTRHGELVVMHAPPTVRMGRAEVTLPPGSFLQATAAGEDALAALVIDGCKGARHVADLFCGVGPFALRLAERVRVSAWDSDAGAVGALQKAAPATRGLKPVSAVVRDLFRRPLMPQELRAFDAVVFDPPRQGAQAQVKQLAASKVPVIVAVSCNAATFARDARALVDAGYRCERVVPVDQFRHTPHVELVARFTR
ncbi:MAG: RNA methyltransferase [Pseudomonadota bacterium]